MVTFRAYSMKGTKPSRRAVIIKHQSIRTTPMISMFRETRVSLYKVQHPFVESHHAVNDERERGKVHGAGYQVLAVQERYGALD